MQLTTEKNIVIQNVKAILFAKLSALAHKTNLQTLSLPVLDSLGRLCSLNKCVVFNFNDIIGHHHRIH